jgi:hypothetical protein
MKYKLTHRVLLSLCWLALVMLSLQSLTAQTADTDTATPGSDVDSEPKEAAVYCANLVYADNKTSVCFSNQFLVTAGQETHIKAHPTFDAVRLDSAELFSYPYAVMTGEGAFTLNEEQINNLRDYLLGGGFLVASAGCSSQPWHDSFRKVLAEAFPDIQTMKLDAKHPIFHSVYDITQSNYKSGGPRLPDLEALEIDGRVVMILSPDGLNDTGNAGPGCCCCGGNEVKSALKLNVNILAYALTH